MEKELQAAMSRARQKARTIRKRRRGEDREERLSDSEPSDTSESSSEKPLRRRRVLVAAEPAASATPSSQSEEETSAEPIQHSDDEVLNDAAETLNVVPEVLDNAGHESQSSNELSAEDGGDDYYPPSDASSDEEVAEEVESEVESERESEASDIESSDEDDANHDEGAQPIYPNAPITLRESLVAIFALMSSQHLSGKLVECILSLIALHCPPGSLVKRTLYKFKKFFVDIGSSLLVFHYFCDNCIFPVKTKQSQCPKCKQGGGNITFFLELPIIGQLQHLFHKANFYQDLQYRFKPDRKRQRNNIEDIYDGHVYREQMENNGFLSNPSNLSFMWYSDGVKVFNSSSFSIWPLCLVINELPYKMRTLPENLLLCGLWFGKHKPNPNIFLRPLLASIKQLETDGHNFKLPDDSEVRVRCKVICGTCDMPAKSKFLQFRQYNGQYGCPRCLSPGGRVTAGKTTVQVYPFTPDIQTRTHDQTAHHAREALEARKTDRDAAICGVKGPSLLSKLVPGVIRCTAIDIMHGVFLGVCKLLIDLWFSSAYSNRAWSLHHLVDVVEDKLRKIKPPSHAVRAPRFLKDVKFWKASEFKLFFFYYSIPVLKGVMEEQYLLHHCKLVSAVSMLCQDSISLDQVRAASALLNSYVSEFSRLYSLRFLGINVHQLLHLPDVVLDLGPLFVFSTFFLESFNGVINKYFHGTQHVAFQICSSVSMLMKVPMIRQTLPPDSEALKYCQALESGKPFKLADVIDATTFAVGKYSRDYHQVQHSKEVLQNSLGITTGQCDIFYRLKKNGIMYFTQNYRIVSKRNESSYVSFHYNDTMDLGRILRFVKWTSCNNLCDVDCRQCPSNFYAIVRVLERCFWFVHNMQDIRLPYIWKVNETDRFVAVPVQSLLNVCFHISADGETYLARAVTRLEIE